MIDIERSKVYSKSELEHFIGHNMSYKTAQQKESGNLLGKVPEFIGTWSWRN